MPSYDADRQAVNRFKKLNRPDYPPEPKTLSDIDFPICLTQTLEDIDGQTQNFLLYDSGSNDNDRFFIFSTQENLKLLGNNSIYADGTFSIAPPQFEQVYTIHALIQGRCVPLVYCLLPRKNEAIYVKVLKVAVNYLYFENNYFLLRLITFC